MDKKNGHGKRTLKDLTPREKHDVRGGTFTEVIANIKAAAFPTPADRGYTGLVAAANAMGQLLR